MKVLKMQGGDAGKKSKALSCAGSWRAIDLDAVNRAPPAPRCPWTLVMFLMFCALGVATPPALASLSLSASLEVHVKEAGSNAPIPDATVQLDLDADGIYEPDQGEPEALSDAAGIATFDQIVGVEDQDVQPRPWHPTQIHLSRPAYRIGAGGEAVVKYALPAGAHQAQASFLDLRGRRLGPVIPLRANAGGATVRVPLRAGEARAANGLVLLVVQCDGMTRAAKLVNAAGALKGAMLVEVSREEAIDLGWASGELIDIVEAEAKAMEKTESQDIQLVVRHPDYETVILPVTIFEGPNSIEVPMVPNTGSVVAHGRTGDEIGNLIPGGQWVFTNSSSGEEYIASLDDLGNWNVTLPDTIPSDRVMDVRFEGDGYRAKTFTFLKSDESSATGTEFTGVDIYEQTGGQTTRGVLTYDLGHVALTFSEASADNDTIMAMIRNPWTNEGIVKNVNPNRVLFNYTTSYPSGNPVSPEREAQQDAALGFVASIESLPGELAHPFYNSTTMTAGSTVPPDIQQRVTARERNDVNAGNVRYPPGQGFMTGMAGYTQSTDNQNKLISEITEAMGLNDYLDGNNNAAFVLNRENQISNLSHIGQKVLSVANTYLPGDFAIPASQFSLPSASIEGVDVQYTNSSKD